MRYVKLNLFIIIIFSIILNSMDNQQEIKADHFLNNSDELDELVEINASLLSLADSCKSKNTRDGLLRLVIENCEKMLSELYSI